MHSAVIHLRFDTPELPQHIFAAISPDNVPLPSDLTIHCEVKGVELVITIETKRSIESLQNTIEDLMSAIDLSLRTMTSVRDD